MKYPNDFINQIIQGDCLEVMKHIPDNSIDLIVTSPPYDNLRQYSNHLWDFEETAKNIFRILTKGGVVVWIVGDATIKGSETGTSFRQALFFMKLGLNLHDTMIYQKSGMPYPEKTRYYQNFEYMFILSKGKPKSINLIQDRKNIYFGSNVARRHGNRQPDGRVIENSAKKLHPNKKIKEYGIRFNVWRISSSASKGDKIALNHPATFPEGLAQDHILSWSNEDDVVFDPFMGSGTTIKMAIINKRKWIGCEISEEYYQIAKERINGITRSIRNQCGAGADQTIIPTSSKT